MTASRLVCAAFCLPIFFFFSAACSGSRWHPDPAEDHTSALKIKVFGSPSDSEQHYSATLAGAYIAQETKIFKDLNGSIVLDPVEDAHSTTEAVNLARTIRESPDVLAVLGHSYSGTTRAALPFYDEAGIPVLLTTATSPYVMYKFDEHQPWPSLKELEDKNSPYPRFANAFRLVPSDVPAQVNAIEAATRRLMRLSPGKPNAPTNERATRRKKVMLICDVTKRNGSDVYTKPMCDSIKEETDPKRSIASYIASAREMDLDSGDIWGLVTEIHAVDPDYIVLIGYPELARVLLEELKERAAGVNQKMSHYTFVMSEACLTNDLLGFGANIFVTSPINGEEVRQCLSTLPHALSDASEKKIPLTSEAFAYDAVVILATAAMDCKQRGTLDRQCVKTYLQEKGDGLQGGCERYDIGRGERRNAAYHVYAACGGKLQPRWVVVPDKQEPYGNDLWPCGRNS